MNEETRFFLKYACWYIAGFMGAAVIHTYWDYLTHPVPEHVKPYVS